MVQVFYRAMLFLSVTQPRESEHWRKFTALTSSRIIIHWPRPFLIHCRATKGRASAAASRLLLPPPRRICNRRYLFVCLSVCEQLCAKTSERICMKFSGKVWQWFSEQMIKFWWRSRSRIHFATVAELCIVPVLLVYIVIIAYHSPPLPPNRHHRSNDDCMAGKR